MAMLPGSAEPEVMTALQCQGVNPLVPLLMQGSSQKTLLPPQAMKLGGGVGNVAEPGSQPFGATASHDNNNAGDSMEARGSSETGKGNERN